MIRGYVSSDEDDYDDYDFGYSESLVIEKKEPKLPEIQSQKLKDKLYSALEEKKKIDLFLEAVERGNITLLEKLILEDVSVDSEDEQKWSALMKACGDGNFDVVEFLLENGADPNKHRELCTPLMICCTKSLVDEESKLNCIRYLLQYGANVNAKDKFRTTALMYAANSCYKSILTELLAVPGIDVNIQDKDGWSALFYAVKNNDLNSVEKLIAAGSDLKLKDNYERTVILLALDKNFIDLAKVLGYVEEPCVVSSPEKMSLEERFLKELPDSKGQGGFFTDAKDILEAFNQFNCKNISLPDLLNASERNLYEIGVKLRPDRLKILSKGIHRYHIHPWRSSSMQPLMPGVLIRLEDVIIFTGSFAKHLTIANASLRYLKRRISSRQMDEYVDLNLEKEFLRCLVSVYQCADLMEESLKKVLKHIEQLKLDIPPDYIHPCKHKKSEKNWVNASWYVGWTIAGGLLIYISKNFVFKSSGFADILSVFKSKKFMIS